MEWLDEAMKQYEEKKSKINTERDAEHKRQDELFKKTRNEASEALKIALKRFRIYEKEINKKYPCKVDSSAAMDDKTGQQFIIEAILFINLSVISVKTGITKVNAAYLNLKANHNLDTLTCLIDTKKIAGPPITDKINVKSINDSYVDDLVKKFVIEVFK